MSFRTTAAAALAVLALTATATACGKEGSPSSSGTPDKSGSSSAAAAELPTYTVKTGVDLAGSKTWDRIKKNGKLVVGVKADQPNLGYQDPGSKKYSGFDIEIAKMIAADLGFDESKIEFKTIQSANRETALSGGQVDYYVGTYTINDERKKSVSFAGPYFVAGQDLLVKKGSGIKSTDDLKGKKVCSATGSTSIQRIKDGGYGAEPVEYDSYSLCVNNLLSGQVDAVTTDDAILKGYAAQDPANLEVVGKPFSEEPYGVGLLKDDKVLQEALTAALKNHEDNGDWKKAYDATLGKSGVSAEIPQLES
ncbi:glutamate ABC transporter substrate-binding protein [Actinacidiphila glaucinigra]|uniref:glutamate ABC transporter substrate-binding protein n=1 Tax=Actinacidiphila glaucinigra TaxID=235986 RepID=UPI002E3756A3|nr:glutamate ABC transporter substrate-binding protein [Actinacidiphila glaucinigra]